MSTVPKTKLGPSVITEYLQRVVEDLREVEGGAVKDSIPALANADPHPIGIAVATVDGAIYQAGDSKQEFCIQSISKAFTYAQALTDRGMDGVFEKIDVEPSGDAFNEISLQPETGRPANPMINAGAIAATSLVKNTAHGTRRERILRLYSRLAGRQLRINKTIHAQEHRSGDRNRALGWLLSSRDIIEGTPPMRWRTTSRSVRSCSTVSTSHGWVPRSRQAASIPCRVNACSTPRWSPTCCP